MCIAECGVGVANAQKYVPWALEDRVSDCHGDCSLAIANHRDAKCSAAFA
eukprot:CAMPEP_0174716580 /NCGR_PEP_ID=MMETSP1094-20130205/24330_1 /TAXON_ID=156173 /ORGANISM="Chrysochromulina brevifilum, Strain UTEX LB 985" /LENGTH=49 /DNA_ID=CAMNT_0015916349 /DNA_START=675 /DNA_END=824 /DNA_ORIENTATION=+